MKKIVESKTKIRFQDCDPFNHLNNGKYTDYFMNHREDMLLKYYDLNIYEMSQKIGKSWLSSSNQIAYLRPALLMEIVQIESQLIYFDSGNLKVEMRMYNENKTHLKAIIWSEFVHFNLLKQKRETHSEDLMILFESINNPVKAKTFDERKLQIISPQKIAS